MLFRLFSLAPPLLLLPRLSYTCTQDISEACLTNNFNGLQLCSRYHETELIQALSSLQQQHALLPMTCTQYMALLALKSLSWKLAEAKALPDQLNTHTASPRNPHRRTHPCRIP